MINQVTSIITLSQHCINLCGLDCDVASFTQTQMSAGEDPRYIASLTSLRFEDIGLADPQALSQTLDAWQSYERLGSPRHLVLMQARHSPEIKCGGVMGGRPKWRKPQALCRHQIRHAPTKMMKDMGFGKGYAYDHDAKDGFSGQNCFPDEVPRTAL